MAGDDDDDDDDNALRQEEYEKRHSVLLPACISSFKDKPNYKVIIRYLVLFTLLIYARARVTHWRTHERAGAKEVRERERGWRDAVSLSCRARAPSGGYTI